MRAKLVRLMGCWLLTAVLAAPSMVFAAEPLLSTDLDVPGAERAAIAPKAPEKPAPKQEPEIPKDAGKYVTKKKASPARPESEAEAMEAVVQDSLNRKGKASSREEETAADLFSVVEDTGTDKTGEIVIEMENDFQRNQASGVGSNAVSNVGTVSVGGKR